MLSSRLDMRGISLAFSGFQALSRVDFTLTGGSVHALTGANGAGKSTLMAVLCGTHDHYEGEIAINNQPVPIREPLDAKRLGIHLVQQEVDVALIPGLSIAENIMLDQLAGAGKTELCKALFGASKSRVERGELNHQPWTPRDPVDSVTRGLALVPEERRKEGIFIDESVAMNLAVAADNRFSRWSLFGHRQAWRWAEAVIARVGVRARGPGQVLRRLSGGNQQKVAIGKWLRGDARVLIFDEPTKGVDVKAKTDLFALIDGLAREGKGVIYASGEFAELVGLCDRICVLWDGRIVAEVEGAQAREETLLYYSTGGTAL
ncbi:TPA: ATP-binding cassette domain-containing protein [Citrobacter koseri]